MIVPSVGHVPVCDLVVIHRLPFQGVCIDGTAGLQLPLLYLQVDDAIVFLEPQSRDDPRSLESVTSSGLCAFSLPVLFYVCDHWSHVEISVRMSALLVAQAEAVRAMPEQPSPPTVDFGGASGAALFSAQHSSVFVFYVFISSAAVGILKGQLDHKKSLKDEVFDFPSRMVFRSVCLRNNYQIWY